MTKDKFQTIGADR